jgi:hypothetical protein
MPALAAAYRGSGCQSGWVPSVTLVAVTAGPLAASRAGIVFTGSTLATPECATGADGVGATVRSGWSGI